ncbi:arginine/lysine/ornithine decarboxylase [Desulfitobacterium dichloroeliminans LMG P-21439]|uniref:Arginine/lysine/ornithine decarboxylase n=1 Tax=Desulfitobacterium dichloroeliminans (strain LMG P-21439 / DCA1) TaxID=871963 RepID=L0F356_DESDL|nr:arginine/lysine/ornithine decarboxylase [Desulfitobacterium dichloroeliminans]AGA67602.1 arginine/lysine/ornithine decarboxylase [Desulfitobacterium dichloroeliminans LMG P-21439]
MLHLSGKMLQYQKQGMISFHTPGHKGKEEFFKDLHFPEQDLTELPGLDMLHSPQGVIDEAQKRAAEVYQSDSSFFLVNGATVGNQGMLMTLASIGMQEVGLVQAKVLVERQSHRSVMSGLVLSGLEPEYIPGIIHPEFRLPLGLMPVDVAMDEVLGIHLTYPSYYGSLPDLGKIIAQRDEKAPRKRILVDQAHGAHYLNPLFPPGALELGADMVLHSTHKTLSALTQGAMLHVKGPRITLSAVKRALELLQSSSPSYLLMASLERAVEYALDSTRWERLYEAVQELHDCVGGSLRLLNPRDIGTYGITQLDWSKILVNTRELGISAQACVEHLRKNYGIDPELWDEENILFLLGIGNTPEEIKILTEGLLSLEELRKKITLGEGCLLKQGQAEDPTLLIGEMPLPTRRLTPRQAYFAKKRQIPLRDSVGKILGESISPYPPGIPLIVMGEEMNCDILELLTRHQGRWQGWEDSGRGVWVIEEV